jgi:endogenous inhibitor of DNA gyrase (YacG/DUF329 family)
MVITNTRRGREDMDKNVSPIHGSDAFNCPICGAYAHQTWYSLQKCTVSAGAQLANTLVSKSAAVGITAHEVIDNRSVSQCGRCNKHSFWAGSSLIYPNLSTVSLPFSDMPEAVRNDYLEARDIVSKSPRAAAALLRLALQKLMPEIGRKGDNLNDDLGQLVREGLPVQVQQALDVVRVVGNNAVHPGLIDLKDDQITALALFNLVNLIVDFMIAQPKRVLELYDSLPEASRAAIEKRDK